jgi:VanZ family protein
MVRTGVLSGSQEHFLAYMISGLLVAAAMPRYRFVHVACFYVVLAAMLELGQNFVPGRDAEALTAFISMAGAVVGEIIARLITGVWREKYGFLAPLTASGPTTASSPCQSVSPS